MISGSSNPIPFNDPGRSLGSHRDEIDAALSRVLDSGWYVMGPEHDAFERELAAFLGVPHAIGVASGTDALQIALTALGIGAGDVILTAANAGGYSSTAAEAIGAIPVYADVDAQTHLLTVATVAERLDQLGAAPAAIIVTHLYGRMAEVRAIVDWATPRGIPVIEDCAQALGARNDGELAGTVGTIGTMSFYPTKNLGALGDGGAIVTSDDAVAARARRQRQYGWASKYDAVEVGGRNSRLDELQAAVLRTRLPYLDGWNARRRTIHREFESAAPSLRFVNSGRTQAFTGHLAVLEVDARDAFRRSLQNAGIRTDVHYPIPDHLQRVRHGRDHPSLPVTEALSERIVSIPLFPELEDAEVQRICTALSDFCR